MVKGIGDVGATVRAATVVLGGGELGLYRSLADDGPATSTELASRLGLEERYVREWLASQAASGYVNYDPEPKRFWMNPERRSRSPTRAVPPTCPARSSWRSRRSRGSRRPCGQAPGWHGRAGLRVHEGCERFFRPGYVGNLISGWLPALDGVVDKLERGEPWWPTSAAGMAPPPS